MKKIRIASIDLGKINFAQYIQDIDVEAIVKLEKRYLSLPKSKQRRVRNGPMNDEILKILDGIYLAGTRVSMGVFNFYEEEESKKLSIQTRKNAIIHMRKHRKLWDSCDIFVIERQFFRTVSFNKGKGKKGKGTEANVQMIQLAEIVCGWLLDKYPFKIVSYLESPLKYQILGAPGELKKEQRKRWAVTKLREISELRNDKEMIEIFLLKDRIFRKQLTTDEKIQFYLNSFPGKQKDTRRLARQMVQRDRQKLDDIGDSCIQCQAFIYKYMVAVFGDELI